MLYGATGYTGVLIAEEAVHRGHKPVLAGRSREKLAPLASWLGLDWVVVSLEGWPPPTLAPGPGCAPGALLRP
jgi:short subunit dehydrogenase-like uncharacterized protein